MSDYLPQLQSGQSMEYQELDRYWLDASQEYPEPYFLLQYKGVPFSPIGGIQAVSGHQKNGKTFLMAQFMAAILNPESERVRAKLPGLTVCQETIDWLGHEPTVLYVDTEMEKLNSAKVLRRVHWLCGWETNKPNPRFRVLWLREVPEEEQADGNTKRPYERRLELILKAIEAMKPDAIFIDGARDIIGDFNDNEEASTLVSKLMAVASRRSVCIWSVLHMNPGGNENKMRGHLGTEMSNKVSDTFISQKKKTAGGVTFTVKQIDARGKDVDDWTFEITDDAGGLGIPRIIDAPAVANKADDEWAKYCSILRNVINPPKSITYTQMRKGLSIALGCGNSKCDRILKEAQAMGLIEKIADKYIFNESKGSEIENDDPLA